jgi:tetratricopeptide (TPR) repeat protein
MRRSSLAAAGLVTALAVVGPWQAAKAVTLVIGGMAGDCFQLAKAGRFDPEAVEICTRALSGEPLNPHDLAGTYVNRGAMEMRAKNYQAAHADFEAALKAMPRLGEAHVGEGAYYITQEQYAAAEPELTQGIGLGVEEPEKAYYFRGVARWGQDDYKGAYLDFKKASELKPTWSLPREQMANFHVQEAH